MENDLPPDPNVRRLKKAITLTRKLQEKVKFEREVSKELARRNEQLKKENDHEHHKYKVLATAFDRLLDEYKELLSSGKDLSDDEIIYEDWYDEKMEFLKTIRATAGLERHIESNDIYSVMSGTSLLRSSFSSDNTTPVLRPITVSARAFTHDSFDMPPLRTIVSDQPSSNFMIESQDTIELPPEGPDGITSAAADMTQLDVSGEHQMRPVTIPLFEHFLVIGSSVETARDVYAQRISEEPTDKFMSKMEALFSSNSKPSSSENRRASYSGAPSTQAAATTATTSSATVGTTTNSTASSSSNGASKAEAQEAPRRGSLFSRMMHRDNAETSQETVSAKQPANNESSSWRSKFLSRGKQQSSENKGRADSFSGMSSSHDFSQHGHQSSAGVYVTPEVLYQYPMEENATLSMICDFCLPNGAHLIPMHPDSSESKIVDFLYGNYHDTRSSRCFVYMLEDKTLDLSKMSPNDETGVDTGRTYCVCVLHPRWLKVEGGDIPATETVQFDTEVCYCFITRFPFFEFFFQVIWHVISYERIIRMENVTDLVSDRCAYEYLPEAVYDTAMANLTLVAPPKYSETLHFDFSSSVSTINYKRSVPTGKFPEHFINAAEWALPPLLHWLSPKIIAWAIGLLMCEVKLVIIGSDPATVSCGVIGLMSLLRPLQWLNPVVPSVPNTLIEFLQSIPPIIAGLVVNPKAPEQMGPTDVLHYVGETDRPCAVLDLANRDIVMLKNHHEVACDFVWPGYIGFVNDLEELLNKIPMQNSGQSIAPLKSRIYNVTQSDVQLVHEVLDMTSARLTEVANSGVEFNSFNEMVNSIPEGDEREEENESDEENNSDDVASVNLTITSMVSDRGFLSEDVLSLGSLEVDKSHENRSNGFMKRFTGTQMFLQFNASAIAEQCDSDDSGD